MKKNILFLILFALMPIWAYTQCTPDTVNCKDVLTPGQICPEVLPNGYLNISYDQTVTILPPPIYVLNEVGVTIVKIKIDTVTNLPPGIGYEISSEEMYPGTAYCVRISGTPTQAGEYKLNISVIPFINLLGDIIELPPVANDTTVKITIYESDAISSLNYDAFQIMENSPNPFSETTTIGYILNESADVSLRIHDNIGGLVYSETMQAKPGRNFFRFTGEHLEPGHYIYSIVSQQEVFAGKMIKANR